MLWTDASSYERCIIILLTTIFVTVYINWWCVLQPEVVVYDEMWYYDKMNGKINKNSLYSLKWKLVKIVHSVRQTFKTSFHNYIRLTTGSPEADIFHNLSSLPFYHLKLLGVTEQYLLFSVVCIVLPLFNLVSLPLTLKFPLHHRGETRTWSF